MPTDFNKPAARTEADTAVAFVADDAAPRGIAARAWPWTLLLVAGIAWGVTFSLAKIAVDGGAHPVGITLWQAVLGALFLGAMTFGRGRSVSLQRPLVGLYVICALLGTVVPSILFFYAAAQVPAGVLSITVTLVPILTVCFSALFRVERLALGRIVGLLCGMAAIVLLVGPQESLPDPAAVPWVLVACAASACYAGENLVIALRMPPSANPFSVACGMFLAGTAILLPITLAMDSFVPLPWPWGPAEWSIVGMALVSALAYSLFIYLIGQAGPVFASQVAYIVTLSGVVWGLIIFGEQHSHWIWLSLVVMLAGLTLVTPRHRAAARQAKPQA